MTLNKKQQGNMNIAAGAAPMVGGAIGIPWGPPGMAVGSMVGGMAGGILSTISSMLGEAPEVVGPTGAQRSVQSAALLNLSRMMSEKGLTSAQVGRMYELSGQQDLTQIQLMNVLEQSATMSPLAREAVADKILKESTKRGIDLTKNLANLNIEAERAREQGLIAGTAAASDIAASIQQALERQQKTEDLWEQTRWTNFAKNVEGISEIAGGMAEYLSKDEDLKWSWGKDADKNVGADNISLQDNLMNPSFSAAPMTPSLLGDKQLSSGIKQSPTFLDDNLFLDFGDKGILASDFPDPYSDYLKTLPAEGYIDAAIERYGRGK